jgi:hypothetical protein
MNRGLTKKTTSQENILLRREWLARVSRVALLIPLRFASPILGVRLALCLDTQTKSPLAQEGLSADDQRFLEEIEKANYLFFWEQANPYSGLIKDRSQANGPDQRDVASIAATGFGLTAHCIADKRGWEKPGKLKERVRNTLRFLLKRAPHEHGFFYHFMKMHTGERAFESEISSIDTSLLLCGVLASRAHFDDAEIKDLATQIYERVDWPWMLNGGPTLSHGWKPETGFLKYRWDAYSELMMIYLLGLGSPTHPLPPETWEAWKRPIFEYKGAKYVGSDAPLFVHQYSHAWFDFRGKSDKYADYFANSVIATAVHKKWCISLARQFPDYSEDLWGITSSDTPHGYVAWGGPPPMGPIDGTVVPAAAGGSLAFLPQDALRVLRAIRNRYAKKAWKRYGFVDAFNPLNNWFNADVIGINLGITLLMAENGRSGFVWETFMKNEDVRRGMERAGFKPDGPAGKSSPS